MIVDASNMTLFFIILHIVQINYQTVQASKFDPSSRPLRAPSRPPAPLLSSLNKAAITISLRLDPIDLANINQGNINGMYHYEVQVEKHEKDYDTDESSTSNFYTPWKYLSSVYPPSDLTQTSTATLSNLKPNEEHRFRVRVINSVGASPWSYPSQKFQTMPFTPYAPTNVTCSEIDATSLTISWKAPPKSRVTSYQIQYRRHFDYQNVKNGIEEDVKSSVWVNHSDEISSVESASVPEIQMVTTFVDPNSKISSGHFWLKMEIPSIYPLTSHTSDTTIIPSAYISDPIPYNASAFEFQEALQKVKGIEKCFITRFNSNGTNKVSPRDTYSWQIEFDSDSSLSSITTSSFGDHAVFPLLIHYKNTLDGDFNGSTMKRVQVKKLQTGSKTVYKKNVMEKVTELEDYTFYDFRIRAKNEHGYGPSTILKGIKTRSKFSKSSSIYEQRKVSKLNTKMINGIGRLAANVNDPDYHGGCGMGGLDNKDGGDGLIVIKTDGEGNTHPGITYFYFNKGKQNYIVPDKHASGKNIGDAYVTIKVWGAGGAGGTGPDKGSEKLRNDFIPGEYCNGGGGGYVEAKMKVTLGETLIVDVGGGGKSQQSISFSEKGGHNGGGKGGEGSRGNGGGGGGMSAVYRGSSILLAAGGGGGGGATDYCCSHGGAGGGEKGNDGETPEFPRDLTFDNITGNDYIRNEFTPEDCDTEDCIDIRDKTGLPAFHTHIERGFAPNASYDLIATGGVGGTPSIIGAPGVSGNFEVFETNKNSLPGGYGEGGKGGNGRDGGGGGGGGIMGGGGGGSGVDGAGGGGGSGYIDFTSTHVPKISADYHSSYKPNAPLPSKITHSSVLFTWESSYKSNGKDRSRIRAFDVELSSGRIGAASESVELGCSDEFSRVDHVISNVFNPYFNSSVINLEPETTYCVRIVALFLKGISKRSDNTIVRTAPLPKNEWKKVLARSAIHMRDRVKGVMYSFDGHPCEPYFTPAPRRGHSLSFINGKVFMFGGVIKGCVCDVTTNQNGSSITELGTCPQSITYSNELWMFELPTKEWSLIYAEKSHWGFPDGREQHSATVMPDGNLLIMGGLGKNSTIYGDIWRMDPGRSFTFTIQGSSLTALPLPLKDAGMTRHTIQSSIKVREHEEINDNVCVVNVEVILSIQHRCMEQIEYIKLLGPQPHGLPPLKGLQRGSGKQAMLLLNSQDPSKECNPGKFDFSFSDSSKESILQWESQATHNTTYKPAESLELAFQGMPANGEWTIEILDSKADKLSGNLIDWKLIIDVKACDEKVTWKKLASPSCEKSQISRNYRMNNNCEISSQSSLLLEDQTFTPRYGHTAVLVSNNIFVMGGLAAIPLSDILRYDYENDSWLRLHGKSSDRFWTGQSAILMPWGLLLHDGIHQHSKRNENRIMLYDFVDEKTSIVRVFHNDPTKSRILSSSCLVGVHTSASDEQDESFVMLDDEFERISGPIILKFGGDDGKLHFDDLWIFLPREIVELKSVEYSSTHDAICSWRINTNSTALQAWRKSCDPETRVLTLETCRWQEILLMAWCHKQYQSLNSPI